MAASYAAVVSLSNTVNQIQNHPWLSTFFYKEQMESLWNTAVFLRDFLERYSHGGSKAALVDLERQLASAASAAEDLIESHVEGLILDRNESETDLTIRSRGKGQILGGSTSFSNTLDLQKVIADMDSVKQKFMEIRDLRTAKYHKPLPKYSQKPVAGSTRAPSARKTRMVGLQEQKMEIMERLIGGQTSRQVIPIVGMGGIGKTTLARSIYEDPTTECHFDIRIWITISQEYTLLDHLLQIPICQEEQQRRKDLVTEDQLGEVLHKILFGRRYLIILDDMWSIKAWNDIKRFFPSNGRNSRVLVTTRLSNEASQFGSPLFEVRFLSKNESWQLFCENAFKGEACPPELTEIGKRIVEKCNGLPLVIIVIGGLLAQSFQTQEYWESVAMDINLVLNSGDDGYCLSLLSLSYSHLSIHLKPCFIYMGIFPEDYEIKVSELINLWIAEGFLKSDQSKSLEEVAEDYLQDLVDRNIIFVRKRGLKGKIKTCHIHDLLRDLCLTIAQEEEFFYLLKAFDCSKINSGLRFHMPCEISHQALQKEFCSFHMKFDKLQEYSGTFSTLFRHGLKLRVLKNVIMKECECLSQHVNLRFVSCYYSSDSCRCSDCSKMQHNHPPEMRLIWNLHTVICNTEAEVYAPSEIWEMQQLRHVEFPRIHLPDPSTSCVDEGYNPVLTKLHTLMKIVNFKWSEEVLKRIPHIKKMKLIYRADLENFEPAPDFYCLHYLSQLQRLESLHVDLPVRAKMGRDLMQHIRFPCSLKILVLQRIRNFCWDDLAMFGLLPHLEVLKLQCAVRGTKWNPNEEEFRSLISLKVKNCKELIYWDAADCHFPVLQNLHLGCAHNLKEIPLGIGDIPTLKVISLSSCKASAAISAIKLQEEQESYGNEDIRVCLTFKSRVEKETFKKELKLQDLKYNKSQFEIREQWAPGENERDASILADALALAAGFGPSAKAVFLAQIRININAVDRLGTLALISESPWDLDKVKEQLRIPLLPLWNLRAVLARVHITLLDLPLKVCEVRNQDLATYLLPPLDELGDAIAWLGRLVQPLVTGSRLDLREVLAELRTEMLDPAYKHNKVRTRALKEDLLPPVCDFGDAMALVDEIKNALSLLDKRTQDVLALKYQQRQEYIRRFLFQRKKRKQKPPPTLAEIERCNIAAAMKIDNTSRNHETQRNLTAASRTRYRFRTRKMRKHVLHQPR